MTTSHDLPLFIPPEPSCLFKDVITGQNVLVPESSVRCPKTLKTILKPFVLVQIFATILFLIFGVVIGLSISVAVAELQNDFPSSTYGTNVSLITFASVSILFLFALLISMSQVVPKIYANMKIGQ